MKLSFNIYLTSWFLPFLLSHCSWLYFTVNLFWKKKKNATYKTKQTNKKEYSRQAASKLDFHDVLFLFIFFERRLHFIKSTKRTEWNSWWKSKKELIQPGIGLKWWKKGKRPENGGKCVIKEILPLLTTLTPQIPFWKLQPLYSAPDKWNTKIKLLYKLISDKIYNKESSPFTWN